MISVGLLFLGLGAGIAWDEFKYDLFGRAECRGSRACNREFERCDSGQKSACHGLALMYEEGRYGVSRDAERAIELMSGLCDQRYRPSCMKLAEIYEFGRGVEPDLQKAHAMEVKACGGPDNQCMRLTELMLRNHEAGGYAPAVIFNGFESLAARNKKAQFQVGQLQERGFGTLLSWQAAHDTYRLACDRTEMRACGVLARRQLQGRTPPVVDPGAVIADLEQTCRSKEPNACAALGLAQIQASHGVAPDVRGGITRLHSVCDRDDGGPACSTLAFIYRTGVATIEVQTERANELATRGCDLGDAEGCTELALLTMESNPERAAQLLEVSCGDVDANACLLLADRSVASTPPQTDEALVRFDRACAMGLRRGCEEAASIRSPPADP